MQIARCFRDEIARPDRQPEFTQVSAFLSLIVQLDLEASFVTREDIYDVIESTLAFAWPEVRKYNSGVSDLRTPFPRMTYDEAMRRYGSDKPDMRFEMELEDSVSGMSPFSFFVIPAQYVGFFLCMFALKHVA